MYPPAELVNNPTSFTPKSTLHRGTQQFSSHLKVNWILIHLPHNASMTTKTPHLLRVADFKTVSSPIDLL